MEPVFLQAWLLGPLLMLAAALGCGLLVRRLAGGALPAVLVLPVGYALMVSVSAFLTAFDVTAELAGPAFCLLALVGLVLDRGLVGAAWRSRREGAHAALWPALVGFAAFAVVAAPVVLTGHVTYTGYARIVDIAHQFDFTQWLVTEGRTSPPTRDYSYVEVVKKTLDIGYPAGGQSALGSLARLVAVDIPWFWQVFMAFNGAMLALALYSLLGRAIANRPLRALAATVAAQPSILYGYALVGGIKEFTSAALLVLTAALLPSVLGPSRRPWRELLPLAVAVSAAIAAFSLTIVPWLGVIGAGVVVVALLRSDRWAVLARAAALGAVALVLAGPTVYLGITKLLPVANMAEGSGATTLIDLGNLGAPMPVRAVSGIWISGDYRLPKNGDRLLTDLLVPVALLLAAAGLIRAVRRRDWPLVVAGASVVLAITYYVMRTGPWLEFKALTTSAPIVLAFAFVGAAALADGARKLLRRPRAGLIAGWAAAAVVAFGVLLGNAYAYHDVTLAPHDRMRELERLGEQLHGQPALLPAWEEAAEYFMRRQHLSARPNGFLQIDPEVAAVQQFAYDPDDMILPYLQQSKLLVLRRGPTVSRPPANYRLLRRGRFYDVWEQAAPASTVLAHVGSPGASRRTRTAACQALVDRARTGGKDDRLAYVKGTSTINASLGSAVISSNWKVATPEALLMYGPGHAERGLGLDAGTYDVWLAGPVSRAVTVALDERRIGAVEGAWSYPGGWSRVGTVTVEGGAHVLRLERGGGSLAPGDGAKDQPIGPVTFVRHNPEGGTVRFAPLSAAPRLCADLTSLDWIELVRGLDRAPADRAQLATAR